MFAGTYRHALDSKNRIVIPSRHRAVIRDGEKGFYISLGQLGDIRCLSLYTPAAWQELMGRLDALAGGNEKAGEAEAYLTMLSSSAEYADADPEWRIVVPERLIAAVNLRREVVLVGRKWQILVLNPDDWDRFSGQLTQSYPDVYRRIQRIPRNG